MPGAVCALPRGHKSDHFYKTHATERIDVGGVRDGVAALLAIVPTMLNQHAAERREQDARVHKGLDALTLIAQKLDHIATTFEALHCSVADLRAEMRDRHAARLRFSARAQDREAWRAYLVSGKPRDSAAALVQGERDFVDKRKNGSGREAAS